MTRHYVTILMALAISTCRMKFAIGLSTSATFSTSTSSRRCKVNRSTISAVNEEGNDSDAEDILHHKSVQRRAGPLWGNGIINEREDKHDDIAKTVSHLGKSPRKRVLVLCTGGTLTMSIDPTQGNSLAPVQGALTEYLETMREFTEDPEMPEIVSHEYSPLIDSSDMGPGDWALVAEDIAENYYHFDGFVVLMGTDTMVRIVCKLSLVM
jgi:hypothetical protein